MIPPKYNFYILKNSGARVNRGYTIDSGGNLVDSNYNNSVTSMVATEGISYVKLVASGYSSAWLCQYSNNVFKSQTKINEGRIELNASTTHFLVQFYLLPERDDSNDMVLAVGNSVTPHYKELNKKYSKENGQEFFRQTLEGTLSVFGLDYEVVAKSDIEDEFLFVIDKYNSTSKKYLQYFIGKFSKTDCKLDHSKKKCELKINALDTYTNIINKYEDTYDLIKLAPAIDSVDMYKRPGIQVYVAGSNRITNFVGGTYWEADVIEVVGPFDNEAEGKILMFNNYNFSYIKTANELEVKGSSISAINSIYAGINGDWPNSKRDYKIVAYPGSSIYGVIRIVRASDNKELYESDSIIITGSTEDDSHISSGLVITMNAIYGNGVVGNDETCTINGVYEYQIFSRLLCDVDSIAGTPTYDLPIDDFVSDNRNYKKCVGSTIGYFLSTSRAVPEPTKYGRNDYGEYFAKPVIPLEAGPGRPLPISRNSWTNSSLWFMYPENYNTIEASARKQYTLKDAYSVGNAIQALLKKIDPSIKHLPSAEYSRFLYDSSNPLGYTHVDVLIAPKSNVLKGDYDQPAQKAEVALKEIMDMLRDCFRCYWYIEDNKLKIEHIRFFMNGGSYAGAHTQLDFTKLQDLFNKKLTGYFQSEVEYDKSNLNRRYEFGWMDDAATELFGGTVLTVKSNYVQQDKVEEITPSKFSSDVDFMLFSPDSFSENGFALLCAQPRSGKYYLPIVKASLLDENGDSYEAIAQNWYASWNYLQWLYTLDMPALNVESNTEGMMNVRDVKKSMKHSISFPSEEDPDMLELIKTEFGQGSVDSVSVNIDTRQVKATLVYQPV